MNYLTELQKYSKCLDSDFFDDNDFNIEDFKKFDSNVLNIIQIFNDVVTKFNISNKRMNSINLLIEKYNSNVIDNNSDNPIVDYIKKISFTTEIFNGIAHVFQDAQKDISKEKKKQLNDYESFYFEYKKQMIEKIAKHGIDKSENGIICGNIIDNNENITKNKNVFVVDIPTVGQLSWHITDITKNNLSETYGLKEYKYEIQKDTEDFRKSGTELNSKLLLEKYTDTRNTHNELVTYIPEGCEDELEIATNLFNIRNVISQRHLAKIEYVYDFEAYSANLTEEEFRKFQPYIALCRIFCVIHNKYEKENNYTEAVKILYFIEQELKSNFKNEY